MTKKRQRNHQDKHCSAVKEYILYTLLFMVTLIFMVAVVAAGGYFLLSIDRNHACYRDFITKHILGRDNYYDGTAWLSVTATLIGAVISAAPGLMCGILALMQTQRLHKLEENYHRPSIKMQMVKLSFVEINRVRRKDGSLRADYLEKRQRLGVRKAGDSAWWIDLEADLCFENEIVVTNMEIESVTLTFPDAGLEEEYELRLSRPERDASEIRQFKRNIMKNGQMLNALFWSLNPFELQSPDKKDTFEKSVGEFVYHGDGRNPDYSHMALSVAVRTRYVYGRQRTAWGKLKIIFDAECAKASQQGGCVIENCSSDGYFVYEV